jgi:hypothetical protein
MIMVQFAHYEQQSVKKFYAKKALDFSKALSALVGIRTPNLLIRSEMLYPIELQMHFFRFVNGLQK